MAVLSTAPMIMPPTHGSGELDAGAVWEQGTGVELAPKKEEKKIKSIIGQELMNTEGPRDTLSRAHWSVCHYSCC